MNVDVARTLIAGQKIQYWDGRIATVTAAYSPPPPPESSGGYEVGGEVAITFDADMQEPKSIHYVKDYDLRLAEPL